MVVSLPRRNADRREAKQQDEGDRNQQQRWVGRSRGGHRQRTVSAIILPRAAALSVPAVALGNDHLLRRTMAGRRIAHLQGQQLGIVSDHITGGHCHLQAKRNGHKQGG